MILNQKQKVLTDGLLVERNQNKHEFDNLNTELKTSLDQIKQYLGDFEQKLTENLLDVSKSEKNMLVCVDSNLGASFHEFGNLYQHFKTVIDFFLFYLKSFLF